MSQSHTEETGDAIGSHAEGTGTQHDAVSWSRLPSDGDKFVRTGQATLQRDDTSHVKHDGSWSADLFDAIAERAFYRIYIVTVVF